MYKNVAPLNLRMMVLNYYLEVHAQYFISKNMK